MRTTYAPTTRLLVIEPHVPCRLALAEAVSRLGEAVLIVGEAASYEEGLVAASASRPDVILFTLDGAELDGHIDRLQEASEDAKVIVMSDRDDGEVIFNALRAGAVGFVSKSASPDEVADQIQRVAEGSTAIDARLIADGFRWAAEQPAREQATGPEVARLSPRESEILDLLASGRAPRAVAEQLFISRRTVECHLVNIYRKLHVHSQIEAINEYMKVAARTSA